MAFFVSATHSFAPIAPQRLARALRLAVPFAKVEVHRSPAPVLADWAELEAFVPASVYQTRAFLLPWLETLGRARKIEPLFITAKDRHDCVVALLCLGVERHGLFRTAVFLGGKESNFNLGLIRPNAGFAADDIVALLRRAAKELGSDAPDLFCLCNQPFEWERTQNPFALLPHRQSPSFAYGTVLDKNARQFLEWKLSKAARKKLRKKEARLTATGPVSLIDNGDPPNNAKILDAFFAEKIARCKDQGIEADFCNPAMRAFFERLTRTDAGGRPWLQLSALTLADKVIATYAGALHRGRFSAMVNSFDTDPMIAKSSPGELLLTKLIAKHCDEGTASFDLGIGEARYKATYCDLAIPLFDVVVPITPKGRYYAALHFCLSALKTAIKHNPAVFAKLRRWKYGAARLRHSFALKPTPSAALDVLPLPQEPV